MVTSSRALYSYLKRQVLPQLLDSEKWHILGLMEGLMM